MKISSDFKIVLFVIISILIIPWLINYLLMASIIGSHYSIHLPVVWINRNLTLYQGGGFLGICVSTSFGWPFKFIYGPCAYTTMRPILNPLNIYFNPLGLGLNFIIFYLIGKFIFGKKIKPAS